MNKAMNIVSTYYKSGNGKKIYIIRSNGTAREYRYSWEREVSLYTVTYNWRVSYFPNSIHVSR